ncbi:MAG: ArsC/Spx/MgsR family protein [Myxococcota bacterium]|nr:ArsC/Spx/MgsR family protein [Myxococcota bacterium]
MSEIRLYHNPGCSKSRGALEILQEKQAQVEVIEYLKTPPNRADLEEILDLLSDAPEALVRQDKNFKSLGLDPEQYQSAQDVTSLLLEHPELMQRPIAICDGLALIARPSDRVLELLS